MSNDISLCSGLSCPARNQCHRFNAFNAVADPTHQSYIMPPFTIDANGTFRCTLFMGQPQQTKLDVILERLKDYLKPTK